MNIFIKSQIMNMTTMTKTFVDGCKMAALQDDGKTSKEEARQLKEIEKAAERFIKDLEKIKD